MFYAIFNPAKLEQGSETRISKPLDLFISWLIIILLLIIIIFACGPTFLPIVNGCQDAFPYRRDANIDPLMNLVIPADFDLSPWTNQDASLESIGSNGIFTNVERFPGIPEAYEEFKFECDYDYNHRVRQGGQGDNRYCISPIETIREDLEGLCASEGAYSSYVIIQKGDVIIEIHEESGDKNSTRKDAAIERLALEIGQAIRK